MPPQHSLGRDGQRRSRASARAAPTHRCAHAMIPALLMLLSGCDDAGQARVLPMPAQRSPAQQLLGPPVAAAPTQIKHLAIGATINASSTHRGDADEQGVTALIDGDPTTYWSSAYANDQEILIDLHAVMAIGAIRMLWGDASAKSYDIQVSQDGSRWSGPIRTNHDSAGRHEDDIPINVPARYIRIALRERSTQQGFTLYEIVVDPPR